MKFLIIFLLVAVVSTTLRADDRQQFIRLHQAEDECMKERNISEEQIKKSKGGDFFEADSTKGNCFAECMFYKLDFMKPGSMAIDDEAILKISEEIGGAHYKNIALMCLKQDGTDACDQTYKMYKCFYQTRAQDAMRTIAETPAPALASESVLRSLITAQLQQSAQPAQQAQQDQILSTKTH